MKLNANSTFVRKIFLALLLFACVIISGCSLLSPRPCNQVVTVQNFQKKLQGIRFKSGSETNQNDQWRGVFIGEMQTLNGWAPPAGWFRDLPVEFERLEQEAGINVISNSNYSERVKNDLIDAAAYFELDTNVTTYFQWPALDDPGNTNGYFCDSQPSRVFVTGRTSLRQQALDMLRRIDDEHRTLLTSKNGSPRRGSSPQMVSQSYPAGVSLSIVSEQEEKPKKPETPSTNQITINNEYLVAGSSPQTRVQNSNGNSSNVVEATQDAALYDFDPIQNVTLTLSTVLNSADVLDRLEYVSTFIYIYPYQMPPNTGVNLERTYWDNFFSFQAARNDTYNRFSDGATDGINTNIFLYIKDDLCRAFDNMKVKFQNVATTVVTNNLDLGSVQRTSGDTFTPNIGASVPVSAATASASLSAAFTDSATTTTKLLRQLDQRSAYISPDANFLRITQRGMINASLGGRFNEKVQLYIPPASDPLYVISLDESSSSSKAGTNQTEQTGEPKARQQVFEIQKISQPLYNQVKALVVSVAVVRHPAELRRTIYDSFGLAQDDAADTDFIVGLPRPSVLTLWKWSREIDNLCTKDFVPRLQPRLNRQVYFDVPSLPIPVQPLCMMSATNADKRELEFRAEVYRAICEGLLTNNVELKKDAGRPSTLGYRASLATFPMDSTNFFIVVTNLVSHRDIRLGLLDYTTNRPNRLSPFNISSFGNDFAP